MFIEEEDIYRIQIIISKVKVKVTHDVNYDKINTGTIVSLTILQIHGINTIILSYLIRINSMNWTMVTGHIRSNDNKHIARKVT